MVLSKSHANPMTETLTLVNDSTHDYLPHLAQHRTLIMVIFRSLVPSNLQSDVAFNGLLQSCFKQVPQCDVTSLRFRPTQDYCFTGSSLTWKITTSYRAGYLSYICTRSISFPSRHECD